MLVELEDKIDWFPVETWEPREQKIQKIMNDWTWHGERSMW